MVQFNPLNQWTDTDRKTNKTLKIFFYLQPFIFFPLVRVGLGGQQLKGETQACPSLFQSGQLLQGLSKASTGKLWKSGLLNVYSRRPLCWRSEEIYEWAEGVIFLTWPTRQPDHFGLLHWDFCCQCLSGACLFYWLVLWLYISTLAFWPAKWTDEKQFT